jgi:septal ring factor EnvC (AmiA/AmiB activator)
MAMEERITALEKAVAELNALLKQQQARSVALTFGLQALAQTHQNRQTLFDAYCEALDRVGEHPAANELAAAYREELQRVRDLFAG